VGSRGPIAATVGALLASLIFGSAVASAAASSISSIEGQSFNGTVDVVSPCDAASPPSNITIDWGDGHTSSESASPCVITGTHTYSEDAQYTINVSYTFASGRPGQDTGSATVSDAQPGASAVNDFTLSAGATLSGVVANWSDPAPETLTSYNATIAWGDGTSSAGTIAGGSGGGTVSGSHTYVNGGRFTITVTFGDEGGGSTLAHEHANVSGCPHGPPSTPSPAFEPPGTGLDIRYVQAIYHDVLGRSPSPGETSAATQALALGATRSQLALAILSSNEYRQKLIASDYESYLHRSPTPGESSLQLGFLGGGARDEMLIAGILASGEYYSSRGHSSGDGFLSAMYCDAVFRSIDQFTQNNDDSALTMGTPRSQLASSVLSSTEYLSTLVNGYFLHYLRRSATAGERTTLATLLKSGRSDEEAIASMLGSNEYFEIFNRAIAVVRMSVSGNTINTTLSRYAKLTLTVLKIVPRGRAAAIVVHPPHARLVGVVNFGFHHKGKVRLHWNRKVQGRRLQRAQYLLVLKAYNRKHKLIGVTDAVRLMIR